MGVPLYVICCFSLVAFNILSLSLIFVCLITMCLITVFDSSLGLSAWGSLCFLYLTDYFLSHIKEVFDYNLSKNFPWTFFLSSGTPIVWMLVHLILYQKSLRLSSILFILFPLFCSSAAIPTILSSTSLICSFASVVPLLIPSRVLNFSNFAVHLCLFILYFSKSLLNVIIDSCTFSILFLRF